MQGSSEKGEHLMRILHERTDKLDDVAAIKKPFTAFAEIFRSKNGPNIG